MKYSKIGLEQLTERFEGCRLVAYHDSVGVLTIGYGHTYHVYEKQICTKEQAEVWLLADVVIAENAVNRLVHIPITQGEFDALVDFTFNLGVGQFANSTLLQLVNDGKHEEAANEFEKWKYAGGVAVAGLLRRRFAEKERFQS